ncbi:hypothetical protein F7725_027435 [Dissostichus mawsoni]|uniref:Growth hormone-releasing hormone receptor n=1 Tax=Dissostichus mawsoni TaxID=36200 RepID=A0A7J5XE43_DISMA|nr:hypothetical protein F7725_027435 [Dissostichus mawsoni]
MQEEGAADSLMRAPLHSEQRNRQHVLSHRRDPAHSVFSSLHPECEFIFQLEREERLCHQFIAEQGNTSSEGCQPFWDAVACWPHAAVGETVERRCPAVFSLFRNNTGSVSRNCTSGGWTRAFPPYHIACSVDDDIPEVRNARGEADKDTEQSYFATVKMIYTVGYSISLAVLAVAVFILLLFRRLRCARNFIHIQLFISFILKAVAVFIKDATLFSSEDTNHCTLSTFACKASVVFCHYCVMSNFFWLLVEALYLNSLLLSSFYHSRVPVLFIVMWIGSRMLGYQRGLALLVDHQGTDCCVYSGASLSRPSSSSLCSVRTTWSSIFCLTTSVSLRFCIELCMGSFQVQKEVHMQWLRWQERSYGVVSPAAKCSQMDTPF